MVTKPRFLTNIFNNIKKFEERGDGIYLIKDDETGYFQSQFYIEEIINILKIYPNMIITGKPLQIVKKKIIPTHWKKIIFGGKKDSETHINIIVNHITSELKDLKKYSKNKLAIKILNIIKEEKAIVQFIKKIPFISGIKQDDKLLKGAFNGQLISSLGYYFYLCSLCKYIDIIDIDHSLEEEEETEYDDETNKQYLLSQKEQIKENVANIIYDYLKIINSHKNDLDYSNSMIKTNMEKIKEKEKEGIKADLRHMDEESLRVQDLMKKHKLGDWSVGATEAIYKYNPEYFGSEFKKLQESLKKEQETGQIDEVSRMQAEIFGLNLHEVEAQEINDMSNIAGFDDDEGEGHMYNF